MQADLLVTVVVSTYNSAATVIETLQSVYGQTYQNIALVISDDFSTDHTVSEVSEWIKDEKVRKRFRSLEIITVTENTGVSANSNRCIAATKQDWLKIIAGDDVLFPNCIADNIAFIKTHPGANIIFSQVKMYQDDFNETNYLRTSPEFFPDNLMHDSLTAHDQYQLMLVSDRMHYTPSFFCNIKALLKVGGYDESFRLIEDYPMWLKLTNSGERLYYFHKPTVGYRIHSKALNNIGENVLFRPSVLKGHAIRKAIAHPFLPWEIVGSEHVVYQISKLFQKNGWNRNTKSHAKLYRILSFWFNPFHYIYAIKKRLPNNRNNPFYS